MERELENFAFGWFGVDKFDEVKKFSIMFKTFLKESKAIKIKEKEDQIEALQYVIDIPNGFTNNDYIELLKVEIEELKTK